MIKLKEIEKKNFWKLVKILELVNILKNTKYLVFFGGAGTSTDSGVKDFRGKNGLYKTLYKDRYRPEEVLSSDFFYSHRDIFMEYVEKELNINGLKTNKGHIALVELEKMGIKKLELLSNEEDNFKKKQNIVNKFSYDDLFKVNKDDIKTINEEDNILCIIIIIINYSFNNIFF